MQGMGSLSIVTELSRARSGHMGRKPAVVHSLTAIAACIDRLRRALFGSVAATAADRPVKIVAFGDSLTAGYGLPARTRFRRSSKRR